MKNYESILALQRPKKTRNELKAFHRRTSLLLLDFKKQLEPPAFNQSDLTIGKHSPDFEMITNNNAGLQLAGPITSTNIVVSPLKTTSVQFAPRTHEVWTLAATLTG